MDLQRLDSYQGGAGPDFSEHVLHKTILVGDSGVGKTSLLVQFDQGKFIPGSFSATVGIGFTNKVVTVDGVRVKLQIWDTAGQERFRSVTHAYYRDAQALLLLYDITNKSSFDNIRVGPPYPPPISIQGRVCAGRDCFLLCEKRVEQGTPLSSQKHLSCDSDVISCSRAFDWHVGKEAKQAVVCLCHLLSPDCNS
uniref:RAB37, member RAS oncogene family n=1 Tax=Equus asinus asinus TaxID=83772 RepID=A0A8C4MLU5_EQUAS